MNDHDFAAATYAAARSYVEDHFPEELTWQRAIRFEDVTESDFLREAAWVVLCSGFREKTLRMHFDYLSLCFCDWESAAVIAQSAELCLSAALSAFNNPRKLDAIVQIARRVACEGFASIKVAILGRPIEVLQAFPYIGPVTAYHLAKNLGLPFAKPDRHLARLAATACYSDAHALCRDIATLTGDPPHVVDLVFWRYLAETRGQNSKARDGLTLSLTS